MVVGDNAFELNIPSFLDLHPMFNMDLLRPYFPPLLDNSETTEQLTSIEINPDCMEQASTDYQDLILHAYDKKATQRQKWIGSKCCT
jgi:hypothetical protein